MTLGGLELRCALAPQVESNALAYSITKSTMFCRCKIVDELCPGFRWLWCCDVFEKGHVSGIAIWRCVGTMEIHTNFEWKLNGFCFTSHSPYFPTYSVRMKWSRWRLLFVYNACCVVDVWYVSHRSSDCVVLWYIWIMIKRSTSCLFSGM